MSRVLVSAGPAFSALAIARSAPDRATAPMTSATDAGLAASRDARNHEKILRGNRIMISNQFNHQVIVVDQAKKILATFGHLNAPGYGTDNTSQGLNGPSDAKVVGDFTGLTAPFRDGDHDADD